MGMNNENVGTFLSAHYRAIMIGVGIVATLCILALVVLGVSQIQPPRTLLEISVAPSTAVITINGQDYRNGIYEMEPGDYVVNIAASGFQPKTINVAVEDGQTAKIATYLKNQAEGMEYFERSAADINVLRGINEPEAVSFVQNYDRKLSIRDLLPIDASYDMSEVLDMPSNEIYEQTISDGSADSRCKKAFCLLVSGYELNEEVLQETVADLGYNLDDYEVIYDF